MITISLCMIVKNEEAILARCLDSIVDLMDEIIIVDTGSTDRTKEIASKYTDKIYDFTWTSDFSEARNFSFSKATMDYIYTADADEILDNENHKRFATLKEAMLPEIEMVQMKYITKNEFNTVLNFKEELRPKIFKRLREFTWIDPIHETIRIEPVVFDSDIEIIHLPQSLHSKRDFKGFLFAYEKDGYLSTKMHRMFAKELFMTGEDSDFTQAIPLFEHTLIDPGASDDKRKEAACVLAHAYRINENVNEFFKHALKDMVTLPCSEMCYELGEYYFDNGDYDEAAVWYLNAANETASILSIRTQGDLPLYKLSECYEKLALALSGSKEIAQTSLYNKYTKKSLDYRQQADAWELPKDVLSLT